VLSLTYSIQDELPTMPKILFQVSSYDTWGRYRTEGYAWTQLSTLPGKISMLNNQMEFKWIVFFKNHSTECK
jgi:hypothetical protein